MQLGRKEFLLLLVFCLIISFITDSKESTARTVFEENQIVEDHCEEKEMSSKKVVLFVCVSNTCRSPMAEYLFKRKLALEHFDGDEFIVGSRSLSTDYEPEGSPASAQGVEVMRQFYNTDISSHRSKLLTEEDVSAASLIVPVKRDLGRLITYSFPTAKDKIFYLKEDIYDPWHQPVEVFKECAEQMDHLIDDIIERFRR